MDLDRCPCSGKSLARLLQPAVKAALAGGPLHGYVIAGRLGKMTMFRSHAPDMTGLYRLLKDMEAHGLVTASWDLSGSGPARRLYTLTRSGRACLDRWIETLRGYRDAVDDLLAAVARTGAGRSGAMGKDASDGRSRTRRKPGAAGRRK